MSKEEIVLTHDALIEMYKAGFLDAYKLTNKMRSKKDWQTMNEAYSITFRKRFFKEIEKELKNEIQEQKRS